MSDPTPVRAGEDAGREATPKQIAAAWAAWRVRHPTLRLGPGPGFAEAITAALNAEPSAAEAEVARLRELVEDWKATAAAEAEIGNERQAEASALRERVARLEEALRPFAEEGFDDPHMLARDEDTLWWVGCDLTHGDFWRAMECFPARAALTEGAPTDV